MCIYVHTYIQPSRDVVCVYVHTYIQPSRDVVCVYVHTYIQPSRDGCTTLGVWQCQWRSRVRVATVYTQHIMPQKCPHVRMYQLDFHWTKLTTHELHIKVLSFCNQPNQPNRVRMFGDVQVDHPKSAQSCKTCSLNGMSGIAL